jgi:predicted Ser/Thr protein kinase
MKRRVKMKKFGNAADKINVILSVFNEDERLKIRDIVSRVKDRGYNVKDAHLRMFIYYNMLYKHLKKEEVDGTNRYSILN